MPSFSLTSNPTLGSSSAGSVRGTIITYARSILPSLPASWYDFIPFVLACLMALLFTALLVLLVEDSEDVDPHSPRNSQINSQKEKRTKRLVGLAEQDADEHNDDEWAWNPRADTSGSANLKDSRDWMRLQNEKMQDNSYGYRYRTTNRRLLASPPPSASPQSPAFTPPILSMAKLIMHRHDQSSKRARASSRPSPPPSPPALGSGGSSFAPMQYTLKSASIKETKVSVIAFPSSDEDSLPSPPASPTSPPPPSESTSSSLSSPPPSPTSPEPATSPKPARHARSRSVASLSLPGLPTLVPALQLLRPASPTSPTERTLRRKRSSVLEEGGVPATASSPDQDRAYQPQQSAAPTPSPSRETSPESPSSETNGQQRKGGRPKERRSRKRSGSGSKKVAAQAHQRAMDVPPVPVLPSLAPFGRRGSEGLAAMEEGARR